MVPDPSADLLQLKLSLHRKLLALMRAARPESEVVQCIVDAVWEHFEDHRVLYFVMEPGGKADVLYSKGPLHSSASLCASLQIPSVYGQALLRQEMVVIPDIRRDPAFRPLLEGKVEGARVDCPVAEGGGRVGVLSLAYPEPRAWDAAELDTLREVAELICLMLRDVRSREQLQRTEMIFRQFAENIQAVFWMTDPENNEIIYVSPAYETIWGHSIPYLYEHPRSFLDAIVPEDRQRVVDSLAFHKLGPYEKVYRIRRPDGSVRWINDRSYPIRDSNGQVYRVVGIAEDLTPMRDAQAQISANAKLASLGEMSSSIAHEINNPLAVIQGLAVQLQEICGKEKTPPVFAESLETIEKMSRRIAQIVKGLRTFSRPTEWDPMVSTDLVPVVQDTLAMCEPRLSSANIRVETRLPPTRLPVRCRAAEISQVLVNLFTNAIDALEQAEEKVIRLTLERMNGWARLLVEDSGPGVSEGVADRIFAPFFTTKEVGRGTGLGLSISKGIVETHGGRIYLDRETPRTRFVVELPMEAK